MRESGACGYANWFLPAVVVLASLVVWSFSSSLIRSDFASMASRYKIDAWMKGGAWTVQEWVEARKSLEEAIRITPDSPMLHDYLGSLYALRGMQAWKSEALRKSLFSEAMIHQQISLRLRPMNGATWASLGLSQLAIGESPELTVKSLRQAWLHGRNELSIRPVLIELAFANWNLVDQEIQQWVKYRYQHENQNEKQRIELLAKRYAIGLGT